MKYQIAFQRVGGCWKPTGYGMDKDS